MWKSSICPTLLVFFRYKHVRWYIWVCWVTGKWRKELAGVMLVAPFPLTRGYEHLFFSSSSVPYQCLHMVPSFGQDVASVAPFSGRLASPSLLSSCNNKQERREASFIEGRNPFRLQGRGTVAWLSPAAMYSVVPAGTKVSEFALGRWEGCDLSHGICLSCARLSASACHKVVTGFRLWRFP